MSNLIVFSIQICLIQYAIGQPVSTATVMSNGLQYNPNSMIGTVGANLPRMVPDFNTLQTPGLGTLGPNQVMNPIRQSQQNIPYGANLQGLGPLSRTQGPNPFGINQGLNTLSLNQGINTFAPNQGTPFGTYNGYNGANQGYVPYGQVMNNGVYGPYGGAGNGNVEVNGDLPVTGTAAVTGHVPLTGKVSFNGDVPCGGVVTISGSCGCNAPHNQPVYGNRPYRRI